MGDPLPVTIIAPSGERMGGRFLGTTKGMPKRFLVGFPAKPVRFDLQGLGLDSAAGFSLAPESLEAIRATTEDATVGDPTPPAIVHRSAIISKCRRYRYELARWWADGPRALFVMLNPSTADADKDDPTIRRLIGFARREGFAGFEVVNLFAFRTAYPSELMNEARVKSAAEIIGPGCEASISQAAARAAKLVVAWGSAVGFSSSSKSEAFRGRDEAVLGILRRRGDVYRFEPPAGQRRESIPHPLMLPSDTPLVLYSEMAR